MSTVVVGCEPGWPRESYHELQRRRITNKKKKRFPNVLHFNTASSIRTYISTSIFYSSTITSIDIANRKNPPETFLKLIPRCIAFLPSPELLLSAYLRWESFHPGGQRETPKQYRKEIRNSSKTSSSGGIESSYNKGDSSDPQIINGKRSNIVAMVSTRVRKSRQELTSNPSRLSETNASRRLSQCCHWDYNKKLTLHPTIRLRLPERFLAFF